MKIKQDFITNSSSCSYIVCIPDIYDFLEKVEEKIKVPADIKHLFFGGQYINFPVYHSHDMENFERLHRVIDDLGYVLCDDEMGPENEPRYINIAYGPERIEQLKRILGDK
jgi:hypothetical protein